MNDSTISSPLTGFQGNIPATINSPPSVLQDTLITVIAKDGTKFFNVSLNRLKEWGLDLLLHPGFIESQNLEIRLPLSSDLLKELLFFFESWGKTDIDQNESEVWDSFARQIIYSKKPDLKDEGEIDLTRLITNFAEIYDLACCYQIEKLTHFVHWYFPKFSSLVSSEPSPTADLKKILYEEGDTLSIFEWKFLWSLVFQMESNRENREDILDYVHLFRKKYGQEELINWGSRFNTFKEIVFRIIHVISDQKTNIETTENFSDALFLLVLFIKSWISSNPQSLNRLFEDQRFFSCLFEVAKMMKTKDHMETMFAFLVSFLNRNYCAIPLDNDHQQLIKKTFLEKEFTYRFIQFQPFLDVICMQAFLEISIISGIEEKFDFNAMCEIVKMVHDHMESLFTNQTNQFIEVLSLFLKKLCKTKDFEKWITLRSLLECLKQNLASWTTIDPSNLTKLDNSVLPDNLELTEPLRLQEQIRKFKAQCPSQTQILTNLLDQIREQFNKEDYQKYFFEFETGLNREPHPFNQILEEISKREYQNAGNSYQKLKKGSCNQLILFLFACGQIELDTIFDFALTLEHLQKEEMLKAIYSTLLKRDRIEEVVYLLNRASTSYDNSLLKVACFIYFELIINNLNSMNQDSFKKIEEKFIELLTRVCAKKENDYFFPLSSQQMLSLVKQNNEISIALIDKIIGVIDLFPGPLKNAQKQFFKLAVFIQSGKQGESFRPDLLILLNYAKILVDINGFRVICEMEPETFARLLSLTLESLITSKFDHLKKDRAIKLLLSWLLIRCVKEAILFHSQGIKGGENIYSIEIESIRKNDVDISLLPFLIFYDVIILNKNPLELIEQFIQKLDHRKGVSPLAIPYATFYYRLGLSMSCFGQSSLASEILKLLKRIKVPPYHLLLFKQSYLFNFRLTHPEEFYATQLTNFDLTTGLSLAIALDSQIVEYESDMQDLLLAIKQVTVASSESQKQSPKEEKEKGV